MNKKIVSFILIFSLLCTLTFSGCANEESAAKGDMETLVSLAEASNLPQIEGQWFESEFAKSSDFIAGCKRVAVTRDSDVYYFVAVSVFPTNITIEPITLGLYNAIPVAIGIAGKGLIVYYSYTPDDLDVYTLMYKGEEYPIDLDTSNVIITDTIADDLIAFNHDTVTDGKAHSITM